MKSLSHCKQKPKAFIYLRAQLQARRLKQIALCKPLKLSTDPVNRRMNGDIPWTQPEMWAILRFLKLPAEEMVTLFPEDIYANPFEVAV